MTLKEIFEKHGPCWVANLKSPDQKEFFIHGASKFIPDCIVCEEGKSKFVDYDCLLSGFVPWQEPRPKKKWYAYWCQVRTTEGIERALKFCDKEHFDTDLENAMGFIRCPENDREMR